MTPALRLEYTTSEAQGMAGHVTMAGLDLTQVGISDGGWRQQGLISAFAIEKLRVGNTDVHIPAERQWHCLVTMLDPSQNSAESKWASEEVMKP